MSDRLRTERPLQQLFIHADEGRFSIDGIQRFFRFVADFKEKLAVFIHSTDRLTSTTFKGPCVSANAGGPHDYEVLANNSE
jgi:hypothetical protein